MKQTPVIIIAAIALFITACAKPINLPSKAIFDNGAAQRYSFNGTYDTTWGDLRFNQVGNRMTGSGGGFKFNGLVDGNRVEGNYGNVIIQGQFHFVMSRDGNYLKGYFSNNIGDGGEWMGIRLGKPVAVKPQVSQTAQRESRPSNLNAQLAKQKSEIERLKQETTLTKQQLELERTKRELEFEKAKTKAARLTQEPPRITNTAVNREKLSDFSNINFGKYHALIIGNNAYKFLPDLKTAVNDAKTIAKILSDEYGFNVSLLINARHEEILDALDIYREQLGDTDNLLIYYAGHGWLDEEGEQGYWLPADAKKNRRSKWISNSVISTTLKALKAKHVMVVADSCYSGTLVRGLKIAGKTSDYIQRMAEKRARVVMTSGGLEPVADLGGSGHSPFAKAFVDVLSANTSVMDGTSMFSKLRRLVILSADQTPEYSDVRKAGHDGGDFLFVRKK